MKTFSLITLLAIQLLTVSLGSSSTRPTTLITIASTTTIYNERTPTKEFSKGNTYAAASTITNPHQPTSTSVLRYHPPTTVMKVSSIAFASPRTANSGKEARVILRNPDSPGNLHNIYARRYRDKRKTLEEASRMIENWCQKLRTSRLTKRIDRTAAIVGGVLGGIIGLFVLGFIIVWAVRCIFVCMAFRP